MKIVEINGGLGNQICQYVFSRYLEIVYGYENVLLDDIYFYSRTKWHNGFELNLFPNAKFSLLSNSFDEDVWNNIVNVFRESRCFHQTPYIFSNNGIDLFLITDEFCHDEHGNVRKTVAYDGEHFAIDSYDFHNLDHPLHLEIKKHNSLYYKGVWFNELFGYDIKKQIEHELMFPSIEDQENIEYCESICSSEVSVGLHIRRGDFIECEKVLPISKYSKAIKDFKILSAKENKSKANFFIFSDDIVWCKENINELGFRDNDNLTFIEGNNVDARNYIDMQLMTYCDYLIHNNFSSFVFSAQMISEKNIIRIPVK